MTRWSGTLAALKVAAYGGPVAVMFAAAGATLLGLAFSGKHDEHFDAFTVLGVTGVVLGFVEWALARRFAAHEVVEKKQYEHVASIADSAAESLTAMTRATREHIATLSALQQDIGAVKADVGALDSRVKDIEDRIMRPALIPGGRRP